MIASNPLGSFYLGRRHDLATGETSTSNVLYDSKDLTTHAVCVGMTGSGKTGLCLSLLEEAGLDGIPAIAIDPKGDLGNLLLTFPQLRGSDFRPWIDESVAAQKGLSPDEFADQTAEMWKSGLQKWGQDGNRIAQYNQRVDKVIYTPGSNAGVPLTVLKSFTAPSRAVLDDGDAFSERVQSAASGVLALLGENADPVTSPEHILLANVLTHAWREGRDLSLEGLIHEIQTPPFKKVGVLDLETFLPARERMALGMKLNNLLASPSFANWLQGDPLDVQRMLYTPEGKPRLSIVSIAHLTDSERMFFVTILLNEILSWMRTQPGTGSLRALLYMDEVYGYFPPVANPPSKRPMLTLLKQARAFGVGCVLATQNPVDLDYKGLSNAGTWFLGRLQTERDKLRVIEGLEGASSEAGASFNRARMEQTLAALGSRVFLMNNVHESQPTVFHTRWAMSYLSGPLSRTQISELMKDRRQAALTSSAESSPETLDTPDAPSATGPRSSRPLLSADVPQCFASLQGPRPADARLVYRPGVLGTGRLHYVKSSDDLDVWQEVMVVQSVQDAALPARMWDSAVVYATPLRLDTAPASAGAGDVSYDEVPSELAQEKNYRSWDRDLKDWLYQTQRYQVWSCEELDARSEAGESEGDFRIRMSQRARELRDEKKAAIRSKFDTRIKRQEEAVAKAEAYVAEQKSQFWARVGQILWRMLEILITRLSGGSTRRRAVTSTAASQAVRERQQHSRAQEKLDRERGELDEMRQQLQAELDQADQGFEPTNLKLDKIDLGPRKADIAVDRVSLVWLPWWITKDGTRQVAY
jgi:hypothetical protein